MVEVLGLDALEGETAFAFFVVRLHTAVDRARLLEVLQYVAPLIPDSDAFLEELPDELEEQLRMIGIPWAPPEAGHAVDAQRRLIESAGAVGVEAAWFFQSGTSLVSEIEDDVDNDDNDDDESADDLGARATVDADADDGSWDIVTARRTIPLDPVAPPVVDDDPEDEPAGPAAGDGDDDAVVWSHGLPPQSAGVTFPVDGYPAIIDELDWEDFGIAFKLAGPALPGEGTVMLGFHTLWLASYSGRYRNASVTYDRRHHAVHLWVDRFAVPCTAEQQVRHLLWIVSRIAQVVPVIHARFAGATMAQKYGGLVGETGESFVLGGNPLLAVFEAGGEAAVDAWIETQTEWSVEELAQMLRELAIEVVTTGRSTGLQDKDDEDDHGGDDRGRHIASYAGELLRERAAAGKLDARVTEHLLPVLDQPERYEHRRRAAVEILGALRARAAVPGLIRILEATQIANALDAIGKDELVVATAAALGAIGDPDAIAALSRVVAAPGTHNDKARPTAADALATCLAASPEPPSVDDAVLAQLLTTIGERNDGELNAETHFAYGRIARQLPPNRRAEAKRRLAEVQSTRDDATAMLARQAALVLASPMTPVGAPTPDLYPLLREGLTALDYDHDSTVRNLRVALRVAEVLPELVDPDDVVWLTRFAELDIRARAHTVLARVGRALPPAHLIDASTARHLDDRELVRLIGEPHVAGRAALIAEAGRRRLAGARRAMIDACHEVISRARQGSANLLDHDSRIFEAAMPVLRRDLDAETIALFDRMLRHSNFHVKWELLQDPPQDPRLIGAMFHVLGERWGWQEKTAKEWLARFVGTDAYELERRRSAAAEQRADEADSDDANPNLDDEEMN